MKYSELAIAGMLAAVYAVLVRRFWFVCDDAYISFRYARNLASGLGVRFNPGEEPPVEGYSNFLWMLGAAGVEGVGASPAFFMPLLSAVVGTAFVAVFYGLLRRMELPIAAASLGTLVVALSPSFAIWGTSGLATVPAAVALYACFDRLSEGDWRGSLVAGLLLSLLRTEGIAWAAVIGGVIALCSVVFGDRRRLSAVVRFGGVLLLLYSVYFAWRYAYFGDLFANTAKAKVDWSPQRLSRGLDYLIAYQLAFLAPALYLLGALPAFFRDRERGAALTLMAVAFPVYSVVVGGDYMAAGRYLVPAVPFWAALFAHGVAALGSGGGLARQAGVVGLGLGLIGIGALPGADVHLVPVSVRKAHHFRLNTQNFHSEFWFWRRMKQNAEAWKRRGLALHELGQPGDSFVTTTIGAIGYFSELVIFDRHGLVDREVADRDVSGARLGHSPGHDKEVPRNFFLEREPTFLEARVVACPGSIVDELGGEGVPELGMACTRGQRVRAVERLVKGWTRGRDYSAEVRRAYVPEVRAVPVPGYDHGLAVVLRRLREGESRDQAIQAYQQAVAGIR